MVTRLRYVSLSRPSLPTPSKLCQQVGQERYRAPEILFDPELIGLEYPGVHQIVQDAITRTDLDLRKSLYLNIVLSGGSTLCKNFPDRLMREIKRLAVEDMKIRISAPAERKYTTWIGGGILAGLSTFRKVSRFARRVSAALLTRNRCGLAQTNGTKTPRSSTGNSSKNALRPGVRRRKTTKKDTSDGSTSPYFLSSPSIHTIHNTGAEL